MRSVLPDHHRTKIPCRSSLSYRSCPIGKMRALELVASGRSKSLAKPFDGEKFEALRGNRRVYVAEGAPNQAPCSRSDLS